MRRILVGVDPGPTTSGLVVYDVDDRKVLRSYARADLAQVRMEIEELSGVFGPMEGEVVCECTQAGPPSTSVVKTTEVVGRVMERCHMARVPCHTYYRREVLQALHCARKGNKDSLVRVALIEMHGGDKRTAVGNKKNPGPLYGVSSHAWQALGVAIAHTLSFDRTP
jgi:Holliday junction resolvasome RuvABC endonuclease subunit